MPVMRTENTPADAPDREQTLRRRAAGLAIETAPSGPEEGIDVVRFVVAQERYAIELSFVSQVRPLKDISLVPSTPDFVVGVVNLGGRPLCVIDIARFFGLLPRGLAERNKVVVVRSEALEFGILAASVLDVAHIPFSRIQPPPAMFEGLGKAYLRGVTSPDGVAVLDIARILTDERIVVNNSVANG